MYPGMHRATATNFSQPTPISGTPTPAHVMYLRGICQVTLRITNFLLFRHGHWAMMLQGASILHSKNHHCPPGEHQHTIRGAVRSVDEFWSQPQRRASFGMGAVPSDVRCPHERSPAPRPRPRPATFSRREREGQGLGTGWRGRRRSNKGGREWEKHRKQIHKVEVPLFVRMQAGMGSNILRVLCIDPDPYS